VKMFDKYSIALYVITIASLTVIQVFALDLCRDNQHRNGSWVKDHTIVSKAYHCCGFDLSDHRHNIELCGGIGLKGLYNYFGSNEHRSQVGGNGCTCDKSQGRDTVNPREKYRWVPSTCEVIQWNATQFCDLLGNRTIYLHGDSTMDQAANSLFSRIYVGNGGCAHRVFFHRDFAMQFRGLSERLHDTNASIAMFNWAAHCHDDGDIASVWNTFNNSISSPKMQKVITAQNIILAWRSNHPPHHFCQGVQEPSANDVDHYLQYNQTIDEFDWNDFSRWDYQSMDWARKLNMKILDMTPLYYRIDSHPVNGDCLHYCLPGPIDLFSDLMLQMLYNKELE
jgi:GDSL/SGNH-like Acyl-Esterase family found in Pmr5 and Cas1p